MGAQATAARLVRPTAWGFAIGSLCFAVGVPLSLDTALSPAVGGWTFFVGSVFFTTAAVLQLLTSVDEGPAASGRRWLRMLHPRTTDGTASAVQLLGTLEFNVTTLLGALVIVGRSDASAAQVWRPDFVGSVLFLVSSAIAFAPEVRERRHTHVRDRSWAIAAVNLLGSVFFGISAYGAYTTADGDLVSEAASNGGTVLGALCFLVGALLLLPRRTS